jgi:glyoxylase-like metal-dependent hydrolase (beta-lactamase superfamily II)
MPRMVRIFGAIAAALVLLGGVAGFLLWREVGRVEAEPVAGDVWVLKGLGGNVGVLRTAEGPVVVDTMTFRMQGERIRERAREIGGGPVRAVINTHYHGDHTHGNPAFAEGTPVVATARTLDLMRALDGGYWRDEAAAFLPNDTFEANHELRIGGKTIRSLHLGRGHTDGDLVVLFVEDRVLHIGDLLFEGTYPRIDLEAGGSVRDWPQTLERVLALDFDRVIPGHGSVTDREGVRGFQRFFEELWSLGQQAAREGWTLDETLANAQLQTDAGYEVMSIPLVLHLDRDSVIQRAWEEATGAVKPYDAP